MRDKVHSAKMQIKDFKQIQNEKENQDTSNVFIAYKKEVAKKLVKSIKKV